MGTKSGLTYPLYYLYDMCTCGKYGLKKSKHGGMVNLKDPRSYKKGHI